MQASQPAPVLRDASLIVADLDSLIDCAVHDWLKFAVAALVMSHLAMWEDDDATWGDHVSDAEYQAAAANQD